MPFTIHPSGYAVYWPEGNTGNLKPGDGGYKEFSGSRSRRGVFFDRVSAMWWIYRKLHLWTFTVPELQKNYKVTDREYAAKFSKLTENYRKQGLIKCYAYVVEAQKRGNIHFHMVTPADYIDVTAMNDYWCKLIGQNSKSAVDLSKMDSQTPERLPAYLAKYMSKAMDGKKGFKENEVGKKGRIIYARSFNTSRDLNKWKPIKIAHHELPTHLEHHKRERIMPIADHETGEITREIKLTDYFFKTEDVIRYFGSQFIQEGPPLQASSRKKIPQPQGVSAFLASGFHSPGSCSVVSECIPAVHAFMGSSKSTQFRIEIILKRDRTPSHFVRVKNFLTIFSQKPDTKVSEIPLESSFFCRYLDQGNIFPKKKTCIIGKQFSIWDII